MRVLVTGGTGFVGSHAAAALAAAGHEVRLLARDPAKVDRVFAALGAPAPDRVAGDVLDPASVARALESCDAVVHAAAVVTNERKRAQEVLDTNPAAARVVLAAAVAAGADPIVHVSSVASLFPPPGPVIDPSTPVASPTSAYGRSKVGAELVARSLQDDGAPVTIVYPGGVWGPHDPNLTEQVRAAGTLVRSGVPITSGGLTVLDVRDLATVIARATVAGQGPRRFLLGGHFFTTPELADLLEEVAGRATRLPSPPRALRTLGRFNDLLMRVIPANLSITYEGMVFLTRGVPTDDSATLEALDVTLRPAGETIADTLRWLLDQGLLRPRHVPRLA
ncbi:MAG: SDR family NAD(P)-dependent oxidoreductase [Acidimicrobiales bacterium]|nr:SDR family NAD(P)-dependent oxidoreductase [Acidimicrobiales bacterium]